jgi:hypothetical protein
MLHTLSLLREKLQLLPVGPFLVPAIFLVSLGGSLLPPGKTRSLPITAVLAYLLAQFRHPTGDVIQDGLLPIQGLILFAHWVDFYVLHDTEREYFRVKEGAAEKGQGNDWEKTGTRRSLGWHFDLATSMRGVGWNWRVKNLPQMTPKTKWQFVRTQVSKAFLFYFLFDFIWYNIQGSIYATQSPPPLVSDSIPRQILWTWVPGLESYYSLNMQFPLFAALTVGLGLSSTEGWPPIMGKLMDVNSVRDFWGRFWHQGLRRVRESIHQAS